MLKIAFTLSIFATAFGIDLYDANLTNPDLLFFEETADSNQVTPTNAEAIDFNSLISSESAKNILLASNKLSFQSESSQINWLETKQKEAINGDPHPVVVCDTDISRTGGQRKALLLAHGYEAAAVITIFNSEEKSCYMVYSRDEELVRLSSRTDTYSILPLSYVWKMRTNTVDTIFNTDRKVPLKINTIVFQQDKVELLSVTSKKTPSYAKKVVKFAKKEVLNESVFFAANNQPESKSMKFFGHASIAADDEPLPNTDAIASICKKSYNYLKFSYADFMGDKDLVTMTLDTEDMEKYIEETYIPSSIPADELFKNCVLSIVTSMSLLPEVTSIEAMAQATKANDQLQYMVQSFTEKKYPWYEKGLTGKGEVVAVSDSGLDVNNCYFWDSQAPVPYGYNHIDLNRRKIVQYDNYADDYDLMFGHGTHCSGTVLGRRAIDGRTESRGVADGVAYDAKIAFIDMELEGITGLLVPPADRLLQTGRPYAKVHSASWGFRQVYNTYASEIDHYSRLNDDFLFVVAAGNDGGENKFGTILTPCDAKNVICVGASNNYGPDATPMMASPDYVAAFSSKGPTEDGRTKPDIVAPGLYVLSAGAQPTVVGECDPADGYVPRDDDEGRDGLSSSHGTSMATAVVSGTMAMIRQYFMEGFYPSGEKCEDDVHHPSNALLRAALLNGGQQLYAVDNPGYADSNPYFPSLPYDNIQGFGRVSLEDTLYIKDKSNLKAIVHDRQGIKEGETKCITVSIDHSGWCESKTFSVTLAWMDKASMPGCTGKCLINDLDLYVTKNHDEHNKFYPNGRSAPDNQNTAERVRIEGVEHDDVYSIYVRGTIFDDYDETQHYALAITGCVHENNDHSYSGSHSSSKRGKKGRSERRLQQVAKGGRRSRRHRR